MYTTHKHTHLLNIMCKATVDESTASIVALHTAMHLRIKMGVAMLQSMTYANTRPIYIAFMCNPMFEQHARTVC